MTGEELFGTMPRKGEEVKDGMLVELLRKAMEDHEHDPNQLVWVAMKTGKCSAEIWETLHELLDDRHILTLATGEQMRLNHQLRFLFSCQRLGTRPRTRSAAVQLCTQILIPGNRMLCSGGSLPRRFRASEAVSFACASQGSLHVLHKGAYTTLVSA